MPRAQVDRAVDAAVPDEVTVHGRAHEQEVDDGDRERERKVRVRRVVAVTPTLDERSIRLLCILCIYSLYVSLSRNERERDERL